MGVGKFVPGCCNCDCTGFTVQVKSCGQNIPGASVTIGSDTETTNGSGIATFTTAAKGASISVSATNFTSGSSTVPSNCAGVLVTLDAASGYIVVQGTAVATPSSFTETLPAFYSPSTVTLNLISTVVVGGVTTEANWCNFNLGLYVFKLRWQCSGGWVFDCNPTNGCVIQIPELATPVTASPLVLQGTAGGGGHCASGNYTFTA